MKAQKNKKTLIIAIAFIFLVGLLYIIKNSNLELLLNNKNARISSIKEIKQINNRQTTYAIFKNNILKTSKDGIKLMNKNGKILWEYTYMMKNPKLLITGDYILVSAIDGNDILLFDSKNKFKETHFESKYTIVDVLLNKKGIITVLENKNNTHIINIYYKNKTPLTYIKTTTIKDGYPLSMALSSDGFRFVTSYLRMNSNEINNNIIFYQIGLDKSTSSKDFSKVVKTSKITPYMEFLNNKNLVIVGEDYLDFYKVNSEPKRIKKRNIERPIKTVFVDNEIIGLITEDKINNKKELNLYNKLGQGVGKNTINIRYTKVEASNKEIILYNEWEAYCYTLKGNLKWKYKFEYELQQILTMNKNKYLIVTSNDFKIINIK